MRRVRAIRHFAVNAFQRFQLPQNARIPIFQMEPLRHQAVDAG